MSIFCQQTAKAVLLYYLREIELAYPSLLKTKEITNEGFFLSLLIDNPKLKLQDALKMAGLRVLLNEMGTRGFRQSTERFGKPAWYALNKLTRELIISRKTKGIFSIIKEKIDAFTPLRRIDFQDKMINNDKYN